MRAMTTNHIQRVCSGMKIVGLRSNGIHRQQPILFEARQTKTKWTIQKVLHKDNNWEAIHTISRAGLSTPIRAVTHIHIRAKLYIHTRVKFSQETNYTSNPAKLQKR